MSLHFEGSGLQQHLLCTGEPRMVVGPKSKWHLGACTAKHTRLITGQATVC